MKKQLFIFILSLVPLIGRTQEQHTSAFQEDDHEEGLFIGGAVTYSIVR